MRKSFKLRDIFWRRIDVAFKVTVVYAIPILVLTYFYGVTCRALWNVDPLLRNALENIRLAKTGG